VSRLRRVLGWLAEYFAVRRIPFQLQQSIAYGIQNVECPAQVPVDNDKVVISSSWSCSWVFRARTPLSGIDQGGELAYAQNSVALYARKASYLVANDAGKTTVNTGCVKVMYTSQPANTVGVSNPAVVDRLPKGHSFYFGYTSEECYMTRKVIVVT
jgi:hypothetical protein